MQKSDEERRIELEKKIYCDDHIKKYIKTRETEYYRLFKIDGMNIKKLYAWIKCKEAFGNLEDRNKYKISTNKLSAREIEKLSKDIVLKRRAIYEYRHKDIKFCFNTKNQIFY